MSVCETCGTERSNDRGCRYCGAAVCIDHHLPEDHDCSAFRGDPAQYAINATDDDSAVTEATDDERDEAVRVECEDCRVDTDSFQYRCSYCGGEFCVQHRTPESHDCTAIGRATRPGETFGQDEGDEDGAVDAETRDEGPTNRSTSPTTYECRNETPERTTPIEPAATYGRTPPEKETIDETSPDVAPDGSIEGERDEPQTSAQEFDSQAAQPQGREQPKRQSTITIAILLVVVAVLLYLAV